MPQSSTRSSRWPIACGSRSSPRASNPKLSSSSYANTAATHAQGHLFGDPVTADEFCELLLAESAGTGKYRALFASMRFERALSAV